jgi:hypothetical protein
MVGKSGRVRWVALGLIVGLMAAWGGFAVVEAAAPSSIITCTKNRNNKTKVITSSQVAKCTAKGKGAAETWVPASKLAKAEQYRTLMRGSQNCPPFLGTTDNFQGMDLSGLYVPICLYQAKLNNANFTGSVFSHVFATQAKLDGANLTNVTFFQSDLSGATTAGAIVSGATWVTTICPNGENSDDHASSCVGQGF